MAGNGEPPVAGCNGLPPTGPPSAMWVLAQATTDARVVKAAAPIAQVAVDSPVLDLEAAPVGALAWAPCAQPFDRAGMLPMIEPRAFTDKCVP